MRLAAGGYPSGPNDLLNDVVEQTHGCHPFKRVDVRCTHPDQPPERLHQRLSEEGLSKEGWDSPQRGVKVFLQGPVEELSLTL